MSPVHHGSPRAVPRAPRPEYRPCSVPSTTTSRAVTFACYPRMLAQSSAGFRSKQRCLRRTLPPSNPRCPSLRPGSGPTSRSPLLLRPVAIPRSSVLFPALLELYAMLRNAATGAIDYVCRTFTTNRIANTRTTASDGNAVATPSRPFARARSADGQSPQLSPAPAKLACPSASGPSL